MYPCEGNYIFVQTGIVYNMRKNMIYNTYIHIYIYVVFIIHIYIYIYIYIKGVYIYMLIHIHIKCIPSFCIVKKTDGNRNKRRLFAVSFARGTSKSSSQRHSLKQWIKDMTSIDQKCMFGCKRTKASLNCCLNCCGSLIEAGYILQGYILTILVFMGGDRGVENLDI